MIRIGEFASLNKVTIQALRYYDSFGLLKPNQIEESNGYRYYSARQIPKLNKIILLKEIGFTLKEIKYYLDNEHLDINDLLRDKEREVESEVSEAKAKLSRIRQLLKINNTEVSYMSYAVTIKETKQMKVATLRDYIPTHSEQGHLWEELVEHINTHKGEILTPCMVIYHKNDMGTDSINAEVVEPIKGNVPPNDKIDVKSLESIKVASVIHNGSYDSLNRAYAFIMQWIEDNNYTISGSQRELYIKGEWNTDSSEEYVTELQIPIA